MALVVALADPSQGGGGPVLLASVEELQTRLGLALDGAELSRATAALNDASILVASVPGVNLTRPVVAAVVLAVAARAYSNPSGLLSETIGAYSYTRGGTGSPGVYLTADEHRLLVPGTGRRVRSVGLVAYGVTDALTAL